MTRETSQKNTKENTIGELGNTIIATVEDRRKYCPKIIKDYKALLDLKYQKLTNTKFKLEGTEISDQYKIKPDRNILSLIEEPTKPEVSRKILNDIYSFKDEILQSQSILNKIETNRASWRNVEM